MRSSTCRASPGRRIRGTTITSAAPKAGRCPPRSATPARRGRAGALTWPLPLSEACEQCVAGSEVLGFDDERARFPSAGSLSLRAEAVAQSRFEIAAARSRKWVPEAEHDDIAPIGQRATEAVAVFRPHPYNGSSELVGGLCDSLRESRKRHLPG